MRTGCHYLITLSSVSVRVKFVVFTDRESCTMPISTNPGSMEAGEYGLTFGTCFVARRLEVVAVARLLWISWCVLSAAGFRVFFPLLFLRAHTACYKYEAALPISLSISTSTGSPLLLRLSWWTASSIASDEDGRNRIMEMGTGESLSLIHI